MKPMLHGTTWGWGYNIMGKASFKSRRFCFLEDCIGAIPIKNLLFFENCCVLKTTTILIFNIF
jgi:hypothetical protein